MKFLNYLFIAAAFFVFNNAYAQDVIFTKKNGEIKAKVVEIGVDEIKYKNHTNQEGPTVVIRKSEVMRIKYENGKEEIIMPDKYSANQSEQIIDKHNALKVQILSPLYGHISLGYERVIKPGINIETKVGLIGPGVQPFRDEKASGGFVKLGAKFLFGQDFVLDGMRMSHPLKGTYASFQVSYSRFSQSYSDYYIYNYTTGTSSTVNTDVTTNSYAFNIIFGRQWILGNMFTLEAYTGVGYGAVSRTSSNPDVATTDIILYNPFHFSHYYFGEDFPMTFTSGISVGYIF